MGSKEKMINSGGINGLGESLVNMNSKDFKFLKEIIKEKYTAQGKDQHINNELLSVRFQMESYLNSELEVDNVKPAGFFLERFLKALGITKKHFSEYIGFEYSNFIAVLKGRRKINSELALKLGQIFKTDPAIWLHIESKNELLNSLSDYKGSFNLSDLLNKAS